MEEKVKVGFCVAYDWRLLEHALPMVYDGADLICLSIDKNRVSWSGTSFNFDEIGFKQLLSKIDNRNKIQIYEDSFHVPALTPMQNEVRQRNLMAGFMKTGGWHIQLDCDEYFSNFDRFVKYLKALPKRSYKFNVCCSFVTLFKKIDAGFLYVVPHAKHELEYIQIATQYPNYKFGRRNGEFNYYTNFRIVHQSWARSYNEIVEKIRSWAHVNDFDRSKFLQMWRDLNVSNFKLLKNFHPIDPTQWKSLSIIDVDVVEEICMHPSLKDFPTYSRLHLMLKNSRTFSRARALLRRLF